VFVILHIEDDAKDKVTLLSKGDPYQDRSVDCEALAVQRYAPRWIKMLVKHDNILNPAQ
jgi:hypothetical protein